MPDQPSFTLEWARVWQAADKVVYSTTLNEVASERTRIEPTFDPDAVRKLKVESDLDIAVAGPHLVSRVESHVTHLWRPDGASLRCRRPW